MTSICITFDKNSNNVVMYQDGKVVKSKIVQNKFYDYLLDQIFFVGCSNDGDQNKNYFKGLFHRLAIYAKKLDSQEILEISQNSKLPLTQNTKNYKSATKLKLYYDSSYIKSYSLIDLSGNENNGEIINCEIINVEIGDKKLVKVPHRRKSVFKLLKHEENGFLGNKWKDQATRWNQLKFHNEVRNNDYIAKNDGLSTLDFKEVELKKMSDKITHINVEF